MVDMHKNKSGDLENPTNKGFSNRSTECLSCPQEHTVNGVENTGYSEKSSRSPRIVKTRWKDVTDKKTNATNGNHVATSDNGFNFKNSVNHRKVLRRDISRSELVRRRSGRFVAVVVSLVTSATFVTAGVFLILYLTGTIGVQNKPLISTTTTLPTTNTTVVPTLLPTQAKIRTTPYPAICVHLKQDLCKKFNYTQYGLPNSINDNDEISAEETARSLLDIVGGAACYQHTELFVCSLAFPECVGTRTIKPCREFCEEFKLSCNYGIFCDHFPNDDDPNMCVVSPNREILPERLVKQTCRSTDYHCGEGICIDRSLFCDGADDCENASDEKYCTEESRLDCDFDSGNTCGFTQSTADHFDWVIHSGDTASDGTGPNADHTLQNSSGSYLLAEASGRYAYDVALLTSQVLNNASPRCLHFKYHMAGEHAESLKVFFKNDNGSTLVWFRTRDQGPEWKDAHVNLPAGEGAVLIEATRGVGYRGDIAIDDISSRTGHCPSHACPAADFACDNKNCILASFVCNGQTECGDYSDEQNCNCTSEHFRCGTGMCIHGYQRCDDEIQCPDGSDEQQCTCPLGQHRCPDGACIMREWLCDGRADCKDATDERHCDKCNDKTQFKCKNYACVARASRCDGTAQCTDGSDEHRCVRTLENHQIEMYHDEKWLPVCSAGFSASVSPEICRALGMGPVKETSSVRLISDMYLHIIGNGTASKESRETCAGSKVVSVTCGLPECGVSTLKSVQPLITNGQDASPGKWPWVVSLRYKTSRGASHLCGGTLIDNSNVITAAHCFTETKTKPSNYEILLGSNKRVRHSDGSMLRSVAKIRLHPQYKVHFWGHDIAMVTLKDPVTFTDYIRPICLTAEGQGHAFTQWSTCYSAGWGLTEGIGGLPEILQEGKMKLWSAADCHRAYNFLGNNTLCAGYPSGYIANCAGDSGGPLMCLDEHDRYRLVGVFSFLAGECNIPMRPPVFGNVTTLLPWINNVTECKFRCDHSKCLFEESDVCNGRNDCGDYSDEYTECNQDLNCTFENKDTCGYTPMSTINKWTKRSRGELSNSDNAGPLFDHTSLDIKGHFLYAEAQRAVLKSPIYTKDSPHCLRFHYHMRGADAGRFKVYRAHHVTNTSEWNPLTSTDDMTSLYNVRGDQGDVWKQVDVDVLAGTFVFYFEAVAEAGKSFPRVALDDMQLLKRSCKTQGCDSGFMCSASRTCIPAEETCNNVKDCDDTSDEARCSARAHYTCTFEEYGTCAMRQSSRDAFDWGFRQSATIHNNAPPCDKTTNETTGYMAYIDGHGKNAGSEAVMGLRTRPTAVTSCLVLHYHMRSTATLAVEVATISESASLYWSVRNTTSVMWSRVEIQLEKYTSQISFKAVIGPRMPHTSQNYIALDDVSISQNRCNQSSCRPTQYRCGNGECIDASGVCNNKLECSDNSDEMQCECKSDQFKCNNGLCVPEVKTCDGVNDCLDKSDENANCTCLRTEFQCADNRCLPGNLWCDGINHCGDWSDQPTGCKCREEQFECTPGTCIPGVQWCDGTVDCPDGTDEPANCTCSDSKWAFSCKNSKCVSLSSRCDLIDNCGDQSDETDCPCRSNQFTCDDGKCIASVRYCDGIPDCGDASDERRNCSCGSGRFRCKSGGCISEANVCDRKVNCYDESDETSCECSSNETRCGNGKCMSARYRCDTFDDCGDGTDEQGCNCTANEFRCANDRCIPLAVRCNGADECGDESDEKGCDCREHEHKCNDGSCIQKAWLCDGSVDCVNGTDEADCSSCRPDQFVCRDYSCVSTHARCDGSIHCPDGSDENQCVMRKATESKTHILEMMRNNTYYPVCTSNWNLSWSQHVCSAIGEGNVTYTSSESPAAGVATFMVLTNSHPEFNISSFQMRNSCETGKVVAIGCGQKVCGTSAVIEKKKVNAYVIGGSVAESWKWPWVVGIFYLGYFRCGGSLINSEWIVTAAHCFYYYSLSLDTVPHYFEALLGSTELHDTSATRVKIKYVKIHPDFVSKNLSNDLALIRLSSPVKFSDSIRPVCLASPDELLTTTSQCYTAGWGYTRRHGGSAVESLREAKMTLWTDARCSRPDAWGGIIDQNQTICAGYQSGYIANCNGDSGGPLMCQSTASRRWHLHGSLRGNFGCGKSSTFRPATPNVYTDLSAYSEWIQQILKDYS